MIKAMVNKLYGQLNQKQDFVKQELMSSFKNKNLGVGHVKNLKCLTLVMS